jgi:hypothetical protein
MFQEVVVFFVKNFPLSLKIYVVNSASVIVDYCFILFITASTVVVLSMMFYVLI